jgi:hypothetical protein
MDYVNAIFSGKDTSKTLSELFPKIAVFLDVPFTE